MGRSGSHPADIDLKVAGPVRRRAVDHQRRHERFERGHIGGIEGVIAIDIEVDQVKQCQRFGGGIAIGNLGILTRYRIITSVNDEPPKSSRPVIAK